MILLALSGVVIHSPDMAKRKALPARKDDTIEIRCTTEQKERLREVAERVGLKLSPWLLWLGLREAATAREQANVRDEARRGLTTALTAARAQSAESGTNRLTTEEIDAEIKQARVERAKKR